MASTISTITGKPPWYGVVNNGVKSIHNTYKKIDYNNDELNRGIERYINYLPNWYVTLNGKSYKIKIDCWGVIHFYTETSSQILKYNRPTYNSSASINGTYTEYGSELFSVDVYNAITNSSLQYPLFNIYLKDTGSMLFFRIESEYCIAEIIITNDGYIQLHTTKKIAKNEIYIANMYVENYLPEYHGSCTSCQYYNDECSKGNDTRTSCYYDIQTLSNNYISIDDDTTDINYFLLKPDSTSANGYYTLSTTEYISNTGLSIIPGEIYVRGKQKYTIADYYNENADNSTKSNENEIIRSIPLLPDIAASKSNTLHLNVKTGSSTGALFLKSSGFNYNDQNLKDGIINIKYNNTIYRNTYTRNQATNIESIEYLNHIDYDSTYIYTQGVSEDSSSWARWEDITTYVFSTPKRLKSITLIFKFNYIDESEFNTIPNSSLDQIRFYYNTGDSILDTLTTRNCEYIDFTLPSPYYYTIVKTFTINDYVKQFALVPIVTKNTISDDDRLDMSIDIIQWEDYNESTNSYTYTI